MARKKQQPNDEPISTNESANDWESTGANDWTNSQLASSQASANSSAIEAYRNLSSPTFQPLTIPDKGLTQRERDIEIQKLQNQQNAWDVKTKESELSKAQHLAHKALFESGQSRIDAGSALNNAETSYYKYQKGLADKTVAQSERDLAVFSVPVIHQQHKLNFEKLQVEVEKLALEVKKIDEDRDHQEVMNRLNGYETNLVMPRIEMPELRLPNFGGNSNGNS